MFQLQFNFKNDKFIDSILGEINYKNYLKKDSENNEIRDMIKSDECEISYIDHMPYDVCVLNNKHLIVVHDDCLSLYNEFFNLVRSIDEIDFKKFTPASIACNDENQLYISDWKENRIIMTDMEFTKLKVYGENNELSRPWSLSFNTGVLYACDFNNKSLKLFDKDLELFKTVKLGYQPWQMKASDKIVCINTYYFYDTVFYSKDEFTPLCCYKNQQCRISVINSHFYGYSYKTNEIYCYDDTGNFIESIEVSRTDEDDSHCDDGCILYFDTSLVISFFKNKLFMKFKRNC